jgi:hypothetical protein
LVRLVPGTHYLILINIIALHNLRREIEKFLEGLKEDEAAIESGHSSYTMVDVLDEMGVRSGLRIPKS